MLAAAQRLDGENELERALRDLDGALQRVPRKKKTAARFRLRRRFWGVFIIAVHRAFVLGLGARQRGFVELSEGVIRCVCDSLRLLFFFFFFACGGVARCLLSGAYPILTLLAR
jgi:hypothetical protein